MAPGDLPPAGRGARTFPAYGPVEAALGYALFYHVVTRATPTVVAVLSDVAGLPPSLVGLGLAALLWFVLAVTATDQARRQLAALGVVEADRRPEVWSRVVPPGLSTPAALLLVVLAGAVAAWTLEAAVGTAVDAVRWVAALDVGAVVSVAVGRLVVFFVAFGVAAHALDRLLVDAVRAMLAD